MATAAAQSEVGAREEQHQMGKAPIMTGRHAHSAPTPGEFKHADSPMRHAIGLMPGGPPLFGGGGLAPLQVT